MNNLSLQGAHRKGGGVFEHLLVSFISKDLVKVIRRIPFLKPTCSRDQRGKWSFRRNPVKEMPRLSSSLVKVRSLIPAAQVQYREGLILDTNLDLCKSFDVDLYTVNLYQIRNLLIAYLQMFCHCFYQPLPLHLVPGLSSRRMSNRITERKSGHCNLN